MTNFSFPKDSPGIHGIHTFFRRKSESVPERPRNDFQAVWALRADGPEWILIGKNQ